VPWWPLTWLAPLPVLVYALRASWGLSAGAAFLAWLLGSVSLLPVLAAVDRPLLVWATSFGPLAAIFAAGVLLFRLLVLRGAAWSGTLALPALWVAQEWARHGLTPHGTVFDLAYTQLGFLPFLQLASVTGPWGLSFLLLSVPAAAAVFLHLRTREPRRAWPLAWAFGAVALVVLGLGALRLTTDGSGPTVSVGLIASDTASSTEIAAAGEPAAHLLEAYATQARALASAGASVIVLPEKLAQVREEDQPAYDALFQRLADEARATVVVGEVQRVGGASEGTRRYYNRAYVYAPGAAVAAYDKQHLLPPFESMLTAGSRPLLIGHAGTALGVGICKDMDFTSFSRSYGRSSAGLLLVPGWDFKVDGALHGHMAIMRGVEGGFSVARAARDGLLTVSDSRGRVLGEVRSDSASFATLLAQVPVTHHPTLFQVWGDWFAWVSVGLLGLALVRALLPRSHGLGEFSDAR
jgi:apolipoprotein N-acyltransferase